MNRRGVLIAGAALAVGAAALGLALLNSWGPTTPPTPPPSAPPESPLLPPGRPVARVGDRTLYEREVGIDPQAPLGAPPFEVTPDNFERLRQEAAAPLVASAVDQVLQEEEALRRGLERDPEFVREMQRHHRETEQARRQETASNEAERILREERAAATVSAAEVNACLADRAANPDPFGMDRNLTPESAQALLRSSKAEAAVQRRVREMALETEVRLGGAPLSTGRLAAATAHYLPALRRELGELAPLADVGLHRALLEALRDSHPGLGPEVTADLERLASLGADVTLSVGGGSLRLGDTGCMRLFAPQPGATRTGQRSLDEHALAFCLYQQLRMELLVQHAADSGHPLSLERQEHYRLQLALLRRNALIRALMRDSGVLTDPAGIPAAHERLIERLRAQAQVELLY